MKLRTILVDDEPWCMEQFEMECTDTNIELLGKFESAKEALGYVGEHGVDLAFLDVEMPEMSGIILGKKLRKIRPDIIVIYISGYEKYLRFCLPLELFCLELVQKPLAAGIINSISFFDGLISNG